MLHSSAKNKGREFEKAVVQMIRDKRLDTRAHRTPGSGSGLDKGDINVSFQILGRNVNIECKNQKVMSFESWWEQTERQSLGYSEPVLAFKFDKEPMESAKCVIYLETLLDLIKKAQEPKTTQTLNKEELWKVQRLMESARAVIKIYQDGGS